MRAALGLAIALGAAVAAAACSEATPDPQGGGTGGDASIGGNTSLGGGGGDACAEGTTSCGGECVDTGSDPNHCGGCDVVCGAGKVCVEGDCTLVCDEDTVICGDACVDTDSDPNHCGGCGLACPDDGPNTKAVCEAATCGSTCDEGFYDCNESAGDGCETHIDGDAENCGECGNVCPAVPDATPTCSDGACGFACDAGRANCDNKLQNGCETSTDEHPVHCGGCGVTCPLSQKCEAGACVSLRSKLMRCGTSDRDVADFIPPGAALSVVASCTPDDDTQALLVTRHFGSIDAQTLKSYLEGGGIVITEYGNSDEIFNMAFDADVVQGSKFGECTNAVPAVHLFNLSSEPFWQLNQWIQMSFGDTGCGYSVSAYPGITWISGWNNVTVAIAYRDLGKGRLWLADYDWQDGVAESHEAETKNLMRYMVARRR